MSLPPTPASNGSMLHNYSSPIQPPLLPHQPELFSYDDLSQPNSLDTHFNNLHHTGSFHPAASFPTSTSNVPHSTAAFDVPRFESAYNDLHSTSASNIPHFTPDSNFPHVPQGSAQNLALSHPPFLNDQPFLDPVPTTAPPATLHLCPMLRPPYILASPF